MWRRIAQTINRWTWAYVRFVQRVLITILLTLLYVVGFPLTLVYMVVCRRDVLGEMAGDAESFWRTAKGYETTGESCCQQS